MLDLRCPCVCYPCDTAGWKALSKKRIQLPPMMPSVSALENPAFRSPSVMPGKWLTLLNHGILDGLDHDWPKNLPSEKLDTIYEEYLSAVCWLEYIINPESAGSSLPRSKYLGEWMQHFEWGLLPYASKLDFRFKFLHAWLVNLMGMVNTPSIKGRTAKEVIR